MKGNKIYKAIETRRKNQELCEKLAKEIDDLLPLLFTSPKAMEIVMDHLVELKVYRDYKMGYRQASSDVCSILLLLKKELNERK